MLNTEKATSILTVNLDAVAANYRMLCGKAMPARCAGVVKADAYGVGLKPVTKRLWKEGCRTFFVSSLDEGVLLRGHLPDAEIVVLNGLIAGEESYYREFKILPTLNDLGQIKIWSLYTAYDRLAAALHIDTGMSRLGLSKAELRCVIQDPDLVSSINCRYLLSHLACADTPSHRLNNDQLQRFVKASHVIPHGLASLAASSGLFLGSAWHFDLVRCGIALYGGAPTQGEVNPMSSVVKLEGLVLQVRDVDSLETVGYGASHKFGRKASVATIAAGYADGYLRSLGGRSTAYWHDTPLQLVGRVSMDLITLDATEAYGIKAGDMVELIGPLYDINALAEDASTNAYEILTSLGQRYNRRYIGAAA